MRSSSRLRRTRPTATVRMVRLSLPVDGRTAGRAERPPRCRRMHRGRTRRGMRQRCRARRRREPRALLADCRRVTCRRRAPAAMTVRLASPHCASPLRPARAFPRARSYRFAVSYGAIRRPVSCVCSARRWGLELTNRSPATGMRHSVQLLAAPPCHRPHRPTPTAPGRIMPAARRRPRRPRRRPARPTLQCMGRVAWSLAARACGRSGASGCRPSTRGGAAARSLPPPRRPAGAASASPAPAPARPRLRRGGRWMARRRLRALSGRTSTATAARPRAHRSAQRRERL